MNKTKTLTKIIILLLVLIGVGVGAIFVLGNKEEEPVIEEVVEEEEVKEIVYNEDETINALIKSKILKYDENEKINSDYVGDIFFESGLFDLSFVQATSLYGKDGYYTFYLEEGEKVAESEAATACDGQCTGNDVYIWTNWKTGEWDKYEEGGSVFVDYRNTMIDQNIIIYGHHFARDWDPSGSKQFTPIDYLLEEEYYEENKYLDLVLEDEVRRYEVACVYIADIYDDTAIQCLRTNFDVDLYANSDPDFFDEFVSFLKENEQYDTGVSMSKDDNYITLFTCIQHKPALRQVVICKEIERIEYE